LQQQDTRLGRTSHAVDAEPFVVVKELYRTLERGDLDAVCQLLRASTAPTRSSTCCSRAYSSAPAVASHSRTSLNHAETMGPGGRVTQVHECCRTTLDMTRLAGGGLVVLTARLRAKKAKATCSQSLASLPLR